MYWIVHAIVTNLYRQQQQLVYKTTSIEPRERITNYPHRAAHIKSKQHAALRWNTQPYLKPPPPPILTSAHNTIKPSLITKVSNSKWLHFNYSRLNDTIDCVLQHTIYLFICSMIPFHIHIYIHISNNDRARYLFEIFIIRA